MRLTQSSRKGVPAAGVEARDFDSPDETRTPDKSKVDVVRMGGSSGRPAHARAGVAVVGVHQARRRRRELPAAPRRVVQSGRIAIKHDDGTELEIGPGEAYVIEPGHDAWIVADEQFVGFEFESRAAEEYARA